MLMVHCRNLYGTTEAHFMFEVYLTCRNAAAEQQRPAKRAKQERTDGLSLDQHVTKPAHLLTRPGV